MWGGDKDVLFYTLAKDPAGVVLDFFLIAYLHGRGSNMKLSRLESQYSQGFTLIELLVTLAVVSILIINVLPSLGNLVARERSTVLINTLAGTFAYARTESIMKQKPVVTCQSNNGNECSISADWHNGWIIFTDENNNKQHDTNEELLRVYTAIENGTRAKFNRSTNNYYVRYLPSGRAYPNGTFLICNPIVGVGKALVLANTGRVRLSNTQPDGSTITCS